MSAKPKKAVPEKAASKSPPKPAPSSVPPSSPAAVADGGARLRRLSRAGFEGADRCALLGVELDVGPRANPWQTPVRLDGQVMSRAAVAVLGFGAPPEALEFAAARLRERG
jgi:hypothetical protein